MGRFQLVTTSTRERGSSTLSGRATAASLQQRMRTLSPAQRDVSSAGGVGGCRCSRRVHTCRKLSPLHLDTMVCFRLSEAPRHELGQVQFGIQTQQTPCSSSGTIEHGASVLCWCAESNRPVTTSNRVRFDASVSLLPGPVRFSEPRRSRRTISGCTQNIVP